MGAVVATRGGPSTTLTRLLTDCAPPRTNRSAKSGAPANAGLDRYHGGLGNRSAVNPSRSTQALAAASNPSVLALRLAVLLPMQGTASNGRRQFFRGSQGVSQIEFDNSADHELPPLSNLSSQEPQLKCFSYSPSPVIAPKAHHRWHSADDRGAGSTERYTAQLPLQPFTDAFAK